MLIVVIGGKRQVSWDIFRAGQKQKATIHWLKQWFGSQKSFMFLSHPDKSKSFKRQQKRTRRRRRKREILCKWKYVPRRWDQPKWREQMDRERSAARHVCRDQKSPANMAVWVNMLGNFFITIATVAEAERDQKLSTCSCTSNGTHFFSSSLLYFFLSVLVLFSILRCSTNKLKMWLSV